MAVRRIYFKGVVGKKRLSITSWSAGLQLFFPDIKVIKRSLKSKPVFRYSLKRGLLPMPGLQNFCLGLGHITQTVSWAAKRRPQLLLQNLGHNLNCDVLAAVWAEISQSWLSSKYFGHDKQNQEGLNTMDTQAMTWAAIIRLQYCSTILGPQPWPEYLCLSVGPDYQAAVLAPIIRLFQYLVTAWALRVQPLPRFDTQAAICISVLSCGLGRNAQAVACAIQLRPRAGR